MKKLLLFICLFSFAGSTHSFAAIGKNETKIKSQKMRVNVGVGLDSRFEQGEDQLISNQNYGQFFVDFNFDKIQIGLEFYQSPTITSKSSALEISTQKAGGIAHVGYSFLDLAGFNFKINGGLGLQRQVAETVFQGNRSLESNQSQLIGYTGLELNRVFFSGLYSSLEGRMYLLENADPRVIFSPVFKLGFQF